MPSETGTLISFFAVKPSHFHIFVGSDDYAVGLFNFLFGEYVLAPPEPLVFHLDGIPIFFPACSIASAAIWVWAMPVGQAVTASTR